ncbi:phosphoribosylanthranilate isomerase [Aliarcobacter thereius]|uniref:N-(5'-phosphoribosyl)anthranilate isomerase n=1 Tax=Aliarcobacter thereius LMG 24486 TaxID=1032240 RepID=A0A1C7WRZ5_9BACT|nr:phosphoribosylanthranilate isomerase [Aliarcobacter thereius]OCL91093.1 N-(5'-phosphoribosyl)anthranilate isomerase [Aliarcobacter thereius]OCL96054.1 N-(5'-phosphoribosyl)anthranilate isomerase [Aliarcobacter thereius LMG 24486]QBF15974.1 phosphoribosylanthranilate isomerase [Aliarcobacter thereius LMG 24486]TLS94683.1 phosphoribosylanthranilate isomerase [Aliarcobacter thereius]HJE02544.1 phosphoribosylanthranilate isomerase [Aliarcobacter thereius]
MRVKICGITNYEDAINAVNAGASALGFVFYEKSPRYIKPQNALLIVEKLPPFVQIVGLFVNETTENINKISLESKMQVAQIIDDKNIVDYSKLNIKAIKVVRVKEKEDLEKLENIYYLVDAFVDSFGGAGKRIDLDFFKNIDCSKFILAGGLSKDNLKELNGFGFFAIDVSSAVEKEKGKKDKEKMEEFLKEAYEIL